MGAIVKIVDVCVASTIEYSNFIGIKEFISWGLMISPEY